MADYVTLAELKAFLGRTIDTDDDVLEMAITAATAVIDQFTDNPLTGTIPDAVKYACLIQAGRFYKRKDSLFGVAGSPEMGNELRLLAKLDPDVQVLIRPYKSWWGAVGGTA
jgi:hypothetical protein